MKSIQIIISGKVQGVFFRDSTRKKAIELKLTGYVKNLENGNVEVAAEGNMEKINALIKFIKNNPGHSKVDNIQVSEKKSQHFKNFDIIH